MAGACSGQGHRPARLIPAQGRRAPRVKSQPQAGPAGTRSALDAWEYRPVAAPATDPSLDYAGTSEESLALVALLRRPPESAGRFLGHLSSALMANRGGSTAHHRRPAAVPVRLGRPRGQVSAGTSGVSFSASGTVRLIVAGWQDLGDVSFRTPGTAGTTSSGTCCPPTAATPRSSAATAASVYRCSVTPPRPVRGWCSTRASAGRTSSGTTPVAPETWPAPPASCGAAAARRRER